MDLERWALALAEGDECACGPPGSPQGGTIQRGPTGTSGSARRRSPPFSGGLDDELLALMRPGQGSRDRLAVADAGRLLDVNIHNIYIIDTEYLV